MNHEKACASRANGLLWKRGGYLHQTISYCLQFSTLCQIYLFHRLTLSHLQKLYDPSTAESLLKHCDQSRNCLFIMSNLSFYHNIFNSILKLNFYKKRFSQVILKSSAQIYWMQENVQKQICGQMRNCSNNATSPNSFNS